MACLEAAVEQGLKEPRLLSGQLALRKWVQAQDLHAPGERFRKPGKEKHVGRSRKQEPPGDPIPINGRLERGEELRSFLHLVKDATRGQVGHETDRIAQRGLQGHGVVEGEIGVAFRVSDHPGQCDGNAKGACLEVARISASGRNPKVRACRRQVRQVG